MEANQTLLEVTNLSVSLNEKSILENVSFSLNTEEVMAIVGPNGAGKSILLKTLIGLIKPDSGSIKWAPKTKTGYLPQRFHVDYYLPMTVEEFLNLKPEKAYSLEEVLKIAKIEEGWKKRNLGHLSSGQLQRVLLAWTILNKPEVLLFDEPTENVDVVGQESIYHLLHHLQDNLQIAIIIVSHDLNVVYRYANKVICLNGKMICSGDPHATLTTEILSKLYADHTFFHHHHFTDTHHYHQREKS